MNFFAPIKSQGAKPEGVLFKPRAPCAGQSSKLYHAPTVSTGEHSTQIYPQGGFLCAQDTRQDFQGASIPLSCLHALLSLVVYYYY
nr:MAG TPA: hypothetical protein [Caudoviricetes sp.]